MLLFLTLFSRRCSQAAPFHPGPLTGTPSRNDAASALPRFQGLDGGPANHDSRSAQRAGDFDFPFRTKSRRRWHQARAFRELLRFVSTAPHSLSTGERCAQDVSARAPPVCLSPETFVAKAQLRFQAFHTRASAAGKPTAYRQARLNSRNPTNIATGCTHRQPGLVASDGHGGFMRIGESTS